MRYWFISFDRRNHGSRVPGLVGNTVSNVHPLEWLARIRGNQRAYDHCTHSLLFFAEITEEQFKAWVPE